MEIPRVTKYLMRVSPSTSRSLPFSPSRSGPPPATHPSAPSTHPSLEFVKSHGVSPRGGQPAPYNDSR